MLFLLTLAAFFICFIAIIRTKQLSWHTIVATYSIGVFVSDILEVTFNLLLNLYKFPPHLLSHPVLDNELGIIFADTLILPFTAIIFIYYARKDHPWKISLLFTLFFVILEWGFVKLGSMIYIHWSLVVSSVFYFVGFRIAAYYAPRIAYYNPPIPYTLYLLFFSHTFIMWVGAIFASPLLKMYQFSPGVFSDFMADCRFTDLLSGDILALACALVLPRIPRWAKPLALALIACLGIAFSLIAYSKGWLIYHNWNHLLMALRYIFPLTLIYFYDRWETIYRSQQ